MATNYRIEYDTNDGQGFLSATCDFENCGPFESPQAAAARAAELSEEHEDTIFRVVEC